MPSARTALVTGPSGFVGTRLCQRLHVEGWQVRAALRTASAAVAGAPIVVGDITADVDWRHALTGVDVVVHLAARVHVMAETAADPLAEFRRVNVAATENLARQAAAAGVRRFVFVSSIKVNGEGRSRPYTETDAPQPSDPYGLSKAEAEASLWRIAEETGLEVVVIRPPLVYGPGVGGNFARLLKLAAKNIPLPLAAVDNRRSLIGRDNLVDFILTCAEHPAAAGECFLIADAEELSTPELVRRLGAAVGRSARLLPVPPALLRWGGRLTGRSAEVERLCGSLRVETTKARTLLGWRSPVSVDEELQRTAEAFLAARE